MESTQVGWWRRHGWTIALLLAAFGLTLAIRTVWTYPIIAQYGPLYTYGGGSDSYYHSRVMSYIVLTHRNLLLDPMLRFPVGAGNPREPLFDWMNALLGMTFAPAFGGNAVTAGAWFLDLQAPLWAALCVFPVYLIGREVSGRRMGLIAALIYPFLSANIDSSTFGYANYLTFYTFFVLLVIYAYIRTVKAVGSRRWIESYAHPRQYLPGLRGFFRTERTAIKWAVFTGVSLGALALAWQGYTYGVVVIGFALLIACFVERIRKVDSLGLYLSTWIIGLVAFPMSSPYYFVQGNVGVFFTVPILLFFGTLAILLPFILMRDVPWVFSVPALIALVGGAVVALRFVFPRYFTDVITGQGYFVKNLIYTTIAEAQAPSVDALVLGYGVVTFFLAFAGLALVVYLLIRQRFKRYHLVFLVFSVVSIYLPISAAKFFVIGSPAFALLAAEAIHRALDVGGYPALRRTVASLSDRGSRFAAFRKSFKARHVLVLALVAVILLPNVWVSVDAGIPGNTKDRLANQINTTIPSWLKLNASAPASGILGAAGSSLDTPNQYDSAAYNWLAQQDVNVPEAQRPAFVSWWDYGFQAIAQGQHPSVADNFQNGIDPAGQFLLAQNESLAIGVLTTTLLQGEEKASGLPYLPHALNAILARDGVNLTRLHDALVNESHDYSAVVANPSVYLPVDPQTITLDNAMYLAVSYFLAGSLSLAGVARVYDDVQAYTGWSIRYAMSDSRLFPFSGTSTGIFYAPADLTGRVINGAGLPVSFFNVTVLGSDGNTYPLGSVPASVSPVQYQINYQSPFYDSMIYRTYIGYNGTEAGLGGGIPGLSGAAASSPVEPGWMLQHFEVVYKTAYVCPGVRNASSGSGCYYATNTPDAIATAKKTHGTADASANSYFSGGESMLAYYPGEPLIGSVRLANGTPATGLRVTVYDGWGFPHMTTLTAANGSFSVILPPGNDSISLTMGSFDALSQSDVTTVKTINITVPDAIGFSLHPQSVVLPITVGSGSVSGLVYWDIANTHSFSPSTDTVVAGAHVRLAEGSRASFSATSDASGTFSLSGIPPGVYNFTVRIGSSSFNETSVNVTVGSAANASAGLTPGSITGQVTTVSGLASGGAIVTLSNGTSVVTTVTAGTDGSYAIRGFPPGNYSVSAVAPGTSLRSLPVLLNATNSSLPLTAALIVRSMGTAAVEVVSGGAAVPNVPVRFAPTVAFSPSSVSSAGSVRSATTNTTVALTDASGLAQASVPAGNYSVYALGFAGTVRSVALGTISVVAGETSPTLVLNLTPAIALSGTLPPPAPSTSTYASAVLAYPASGSGVVVAWGNATGSFAMFVPAGTYGLLGVESPFSGTSLSYAALGSAQVSNATTVALSPSPAVAVELTVGTNGSNGFYGAAGANVTVSAGPHGPTIRAVTSPSASVGLSLPSSIPSSAGGYCVAASAPGFTPVERCGFTPSALAGLSTLYLPLETVPVSLDVAGVPTGTSVTVNLTGESPTTTFHSFTGGPAFSLRLAPGNYSIVAEGSGANGTILYRSPAAINTTVPFGATFARVSLHVLPEVKAKGTLVLPKKIHAAQVTVSLASPQLNVTGNGTVFTSALRVAPGNYTARINGTNATAGLRYANLTYVNVAPDGTITPTLVLSRPAVTLVGTLDATNGTRLSIQPTLTLVGAAGATVLVTPASGSFSVVLPPNGTYSVFANATVRTAGPNGSVAETWSTVPGATCTVGAGDSTCPVTFVGAIQPAWLNGTLVRAGAVGTIPGTLRLVGPYPSSNITLVNATNGSFSVLLPPGAYRAYAVASGGAPFAALTQVLVLPSSGSVALPLLPTWTAAISVVSSGAASQTVGAASVTVKGSFGTTLFSPVALGTTLDLALPVGVYSVSARAPGTLHGFAGNATANATVAVRSGNVGTTLALNVPVQRKVVGTLVGASSATVPAGGAATFSFSVKDTGNVPVTVRPVGSPAFWNFSFAIANLTLTPGGGAVSDEVRVGVPAGTLTNHAPVAVSFVLANGTTVGSLAPAPTVHVVPYYGLAIGRGSSQPVQVGTARVLVTFFVHDTGNAPETVALSIANLHTLSSLGWSAALTQTSGAALALPVNVAGGSNQTYLVNLTSAATVYLPPGSVTITASVTNVTGLVATTTIAVPGIGLHPGSTTSFVVTGPSVGSAQSTLPWGLVAFLAFVPAIALAATVLLYRWWRTRKWIRR